MKRFLMFSAACAAVVLAPLAAKAGDPVKSGPEAGSSPMLHITPFNAEGGEFCVTCKAGLNPAAFAFLSKNDEASQKLILALDAAVKAKADKKLNSVIVILGAGDDANGLKQFITDKKVAVPAAVVPADFAGLKAWKINAEAANTVVFLKEHKVASSVADTDDEDTNKEIDTLTG